MTPPAAPPARRGALYVLLEKATAVVLVLVLLSLAWMVAGALQPALVAWLPTGVQVAAVLVLLAAALVLVSAVALLHTRA